jgi:hypothetical protein
MATTQNTFTGNGSNLGPFSFTFKWLESTDIKVSVGGVLKTAGTHYNLQSLNYTTKTGGQVLFTAGNAPANGASIRIYRDTDDEALSAVFSSGSAIRAKDLNDNFTQNLYVTQEVNNNALNVDGSNPMVGNLNMNGYQLNNLGDPVVNNNAVTKLYVDSRLGSLSIPGFTRWSKTAVGGETTLSGVGTTGGTLGYSPNREQVYLNGAQLQRDADYTANNGTSIVLNVALIAGDVLEVICVNNLNTGTTAQAQDVYWNQSSSGAVTRTVESKLRDTVSVLDFIPTSEHAAIKAGTSTYNAASAIQAALTASKSVYVPAGTYLLNSGVTVVSNQTLFGDGPASILKANANNVTIINTGIAVAKTNITIKDLLLDGSSLLATAGISGHRVSYFNILNVVVQNFGAMNVGAPTTDVNHGGMGITVQASSDVGSETDNITIRNVRVKNIAGGGNIKGDGIYIDSYRASTDSYVNAVIDGCWVSTCGRNCYTVAGGPAGGPGLGIPYNVKISNCYAEKSALSGLDIEAGSDVTVTSCTFKRCGNDTTYHDSNTTYGSTHELRAGIGLPNYNKNITISNCSFQDCYYGVTTGGVDGLKIEGCYFVDNDASDLIRTLASSPINFTLSDCNFNSTAATQGFLAYYNAAAANFVASNCTFSKLVSVDGIKQADFNQCTFKNGFVFNGGGGGGVTGDVTFTGCIFSNFTGSAVTCSTPNAAFGPVNFYNCDFRGTGSLVNGITVAYHSAALWIVKGCKFKGLTNAGIFVSSGDMWASFAQIHDNYFIGCTHGILHDQGADVLSISNNLFNDCTTCIAFSPVFGAGYTGNSALTIIGNRSAGTTSTGISVPGPAQVQVVVVGNDMRACSGTKFNFPTAANSVIASNYP